MLQSNHYIANMSQQPDQFYLNQPEPNRGCLLALRDIILAMDEQVTATIKYGMPCFCYRNKMFCYLWTDKKTAEPYILMVEGQRLEHPQLEAGTRARMKILRVNPNEDLSVDVIRLILNDALDLYRKGIIPVK